MKTAETEPAAPRNGAAKKAALGAAALLAAAAAATYYLYFRNYETTDDAYLEGHVIAISPNVAGTVVKVHFTDNQEVRSGELLVEIDPRPYAVRLAQAQADIDAQKAEALRATTDVARYRQLFAQDAISRQSLDHAEATAQSEQAKLELALKKAAAARLDLSYTRIQAPESGRAARKAVEEGAYVQVGQQLLALVPSQVWVTANFKETQLTRMRPGQPVAISVDAYPDRKFKGKVDSIQSGTGSRFSLLPPENATGNFVKVVQRVPVKIVFDPPPGPDVLLAPGMSVVPEVKVR